MAIIKRTEKINIGFFVLGGNPVKQEGLLMQQKPWLQLGDKF